MVESIPFHTEVCIFSRFMHTFQQKNSGKHPFSYRSMHILQIYAHFQQKHSGKHPFPYRSVHILQIYAHFPAEIVIFGCIKHQEMKRLHAFVLTLLAVWGIAAGEMKGQSFEGTWSGEIDVNGSKLGLVFHIGETCTLDVPAQGAKDIPAKFNVDNGSLKIGIPLLGASYEGMFFMGSIMGTFRQNGMEFPLTLKQGEPVPKRPQTPVGPFPYETTEVTFRNGDAVLSGTLTMPATVGKDVPVLLMVSGSGQQNRDEELMDHKPFAVIADAFARNGIATLRYDDRGCGASTGDLTTATTDTFAADALEGIRFLRAQGYAKVGILGHSEGGTIAFMLAASADGPDFIISLAGMAENGEATLLAQTEKIAVVQGLPEDQAKAYAKQSVTSAKTASNTWMKRFLELDPTAYISKITCPVLALNGEKDLQVIADRNIHIIKDSLPSATVKTYPDLNHLFQHCKTGSPTEYYEIEETISPEVLADMVNWIKTL